MEIREAIFPDDLSVVRTLFEEYAAGVGVDLCFQGFAAEVAGLPGRYAAPDGGVWLAVEGDAAIGCVALRPLDGGRGEIKRLYVRPAGRGAGVGRRLVEEVLRTAAAKGYARVCLDTLPSMGGAIALYRTLGFTEIAPYCPNPVPGALYLGRELTTGSGRGS